MEGLRSSRGKEKLDGDCFLIDSYKGNDGLRKSSNLDSDANGN